MVIRTLVTLALLFCGLSAKAEFITQIPGAFSPTSVSGLTAILSQFDTNAGPLEPNIGFAYDDFTFSMSGTVDSLQWIGAYDTGVTPGLAPNFTVKFYQDNANAPGALAATFNVTPTETFIADFGAPGTSYFQYSTNATNFNVVSGQKYWVSVQARLDFTNQAGWGLAYSSFGGNNVSVNDFYDDLGVPPGYVRTIDPQDYAMAINVVQAVPEPGTGLLALGACAGLGFWRKRKNLAGRLASFCRIGKLG